ncbi:MAG: hypothetical protein M0017_08825 [Desulfobacteraceae bacterium]|nr:hypothetical protein [Desulfobacteraceae bacterium]
MYLAQRVIDGSLHYTLSRSYEENGWWQSEDLIDLGPEPACFVKGCAEGGFSVDAAIAEALRGRGAAAGPGELEELFLPFAPAHLREVRQRWWQRPSRRPRRVRLLPPHRKRLEAQVGLFDRRRLWYLTTGATDLATIGLVPIEAFVVLGDKSRDEIEQYLLAREQRLDPAGHRRYLFAIFNLQHWFIYLQGRSMPPELDRPYLDQLFLDELCRVNGDPRFWMRDDPPWQLHPHLTRYATMYFDADWDWDPFREEDYARGRGAGEERRARRQGADDSGEADALFGRSMGELRAMSRHELTQLYKKRALQLHPDHGGDPEQFVLLTQAFEALLAECER